MSVGLFAILQSSYWLLYNYLDSFVQPKCRLNKISNNIYSAKMSAKPLFPKKCAKDRFFRTSNTNAIVTETKVRRLIMKPWMILQILNGNIYPHQLIHAFYILIILLIGCGWRLFSECGYKAVFKILQKLRRLFTKMVTLEKRQFCFVP